MNSDLEFEFETYKKNDDGFSSKKINFRLEFFFFRSRNFKNREHYFFFSRLFDSWFKSQSNSIFDKLSSFQEKFLNNSFKLNLLS